MCHCSWGKAKKHRAVHNSQDGTSTSFVKAFMIKLLPTDHTSDLQRTLGWFESLVRKGDSRGERL